MSRSASDKDVVSADNVRAPMQVYNKDFWSSENLKFSEPWYRIEKSARLVSRLARGRERSLLDIGCGPATLMRLLPPNVHYYGIDIAIHKPAPNLLESDILKNPIGFGDQQFDIVIAQGLFEYLGNSQNLKLAEITKVLKESGTFIVSYTNFRHRRPLIYHAFNNVVSLEEFRSDLARHFDVLRCFPFSHNWKHGQPVRKLVKAANMHFSRNIPFISDVLAVEYFFICTPRGAGRRRTQWR